MEAAIVLSLLAAMAPAPVPGAPLVGASESGRLDAGAEDARAEDGGAPGGWGTRLVARVEPGEVQLGEPFELIVEVTRAADERLELLLPQDLGDVELRAPPERSSRPEGGALRETFRVPLAAYALRDVRTPALSLRSSSGAQLEVPPLPVSVKRTLEEQGPEVGLAEPMAPVALERFDERPVALAAVALLALSLGLLLWWLHRRRPLASAPSARRVVEPPPDVVALKRLRALERSSLISQGELERFVDEAVEILRWYLGKRYQVDALESTSLELHQALSQVLDARLNVDEVDKLLADADLVKFARAPTTTRACASLLEEIGGLVNRTRAQPKTAAQEAA